MRCGVSLGKASIKARYSRGRVQRAGRESPISEYACCFSCSDFQVCTLAQASEKRQWADIAGLFLPGGVGFRWASYDPESWVPKRSSWHGLGFFPEAGVSDGWA